MGWDWDWQISSHHISLPTKNENFSNWNEIPSHLISFGMGSGHIFIQKYIYIGTWMRHFFYLTRMYGTRIGKSHSILSHCQPYCELIRIRIYPKYLSDWNPIRFIVNKVGLNLKFILKLDGFFSIPTIRNQIEFGQIWSFLAFSWINIMN